MEIVYVSFDRTKEEYDEYRKPMPWVALPYDQKKRDELKKEYKIIGIPHLVVLKPDGTVVVQNGRPDVQKKKVHAFHEWMTTVAYLGLS